MNMFYKLYGHYKDIWDYEMRLTAANVTHAEAFERSQREEEWL